PAAAPQGTTVTVRDIFFNVPARRKFLKSPATELSHICDVLNRMALAHPAVHFRLEHDGRRVADYAAVGAPRDRLHQVLGREAAKSVAPFDWEQGEFSVRGFLSAAPASFPNPRYLFTYVNRRYVRDKVLTHAIIQGYENLLMKGQYPAVVLFLGLPFEEVDVNVHPAKYEVRGALRQEVREPSRASMETPAAPFAGVSESASAYGAPLPGAQIFRQPA